MIEWYLYLYISKRSVKIFSKMCITHNKYCVATMTIFCYYFLFNSNEHRVHTFNCQYILFFMKLFFWYYYCVSQFFSLILFFKIYLIQFNYQLFCKYIIILDSFHYYIFTVFTRSIYLSPRKIALSLLFTFLNCYMNIIFFLVIHNSRSQIKKQINPIFT